MAGVPRPAVLITSLSSPSGGTRVLEPSKDPLM